MFSHLERLNRGHGRGPSAKTFRQMFGGLASRDLKILSGAFGGEILHYRERRGLAADAVILAPGGRWGACAFVLGGRKPSDEAAARLLKVAGRFKENGPASLMVVTGIGKYAYRRADGILEVQIACLEP